MKTEFRKETITKHIYRIFGTGDVCMYFIKGSRKGLLIDTGYGIGDLKSYVEQEFAVPYEVIITHGHWDHANGAGQWDEVYLNEADRELYREFVSVSFRKDRLRKTVKDIDSYPDDVFMPEFSGEFLDLDDGMTFDLGELTVEVISAPGHTMGIVTLLVIEDRTLIIGDACGEFTFMFRKETSTIEKYYETLNKLNDLSERYDLILRQHGSCTSPKNLITDNIDTVNDILNGTDDHVAWEYMGQKVFIAKRIDPATHQRYDGRSGNIVYSTDKIR